MALRTADFISCLNAAIPFAYSAGDFPDTAPDEAACVKLAGGPPPSAHTSYRQPAVQIIVRGAAAGIQAAEEKALELFDWLHNRRELELTAGGTVVRQCTAAQSSPVYSGRDESGRPLFTLNFVCVISE